MVVRPSGTEIAFAVDPLRRHLLLEGLDDIGQTLQHAGAIDRFETERRRSHDWFPAIELGC